jgi:hypothetical protein
MTFVRDLISDLVSKRLWPVAVVLLGALIAVPMIISKPAPDNSAEEAAARVTAAQAAKESAAAAPVVTVTAVQTKSAVKGLHAKDPFRRAKAAGTSVTVKGGASDGGAPISGGSNGSGGSGSGGSGGSGDTGGTQTPNANEPAKTYTTYSVDLRFNEAGKTAKIRRDIARLTALPSSLDPVLVYMGLLADGKTAVFLVNADATPQGDATCKPKKSECTYVYLQEGETEFFDVGSGADIIQYELKVLHIDPHKTTSKSEAKAVYARESKAGRVVLRAASASLGYLHYASYNGTLKVTPEPPVTEDADAHASAAPGASLGA